MNARLGLDLGGSAIKWVRLAGDEVAAAGRLPTPHGGPKAVVAALCAAAAAATDGVRVSGVGVGVPGVLSADGQVEGLTNVPGDWAGVPLRQLLADELGIPVALANDARAFTLAEARLGAVRGVADALCVTVGTGVGGGVVAGSRVILGAGQRGGEFGHQSVVPDGARCGCGGTGCVEVYASAPGVLAAGVRAVLQGLDTRLRDVCDGDVSALTPADVLRAAALGDPHARAAVDRAGDALGRGVANVATVLAPERVVVGGGFGLAAFAFLRPAIEAALAERARLVPPPEVVPAGLGEQGGAIGAALWGDGAAHLQS